ncbi:GNAT family N-acetyltransferase [Mangrovibacterium sp.]|uniref:GNAT family N-acetyltransferase n=1 Tax=Mangrovibacterium sp. TaxID=1961364 RepID=UPI003568A160
MNPLKIERAGASDLKEVFELEQLSFNAEAFSKRQLRYLMLKAKSDFLVTRENGEISSFMILLKKKNSSGMRVYSLAVSAKHRGKGIAQSMLDEALRRAASSGYKFLTLEVSEHNEAAVKLYLKQGFEVFGERRAYYKDGSKALLMRKSVG